MRIYILYIFLLSSVILNAQQNDFLKINARDISSLQLSQIAAKIDSLPLSKSFQSSSSLFLSGKSIYMLGMRSILQFTTEGQFVQEINCDGFALDIAGDETKKELYVPVRKEEKYFLNCYNFEGRLKKVLALEQDIVCCRFFENKLWLLQATICNDTVSYSLSNLDISSKEKREYGVFHKDYYREGFTITSKGSFSVLNNNLFFNIYTDTVMYQIRGDKYAPYVSWEIKPKCRFLNERGVIAAKAIIGRYLFINYSRNDESDKEGVTCQSYLYVKDLKDGADFNIGCEWDFEGAAKGIEDDISGLGHVLVGASINRKDCFYVRKTSNGKPYLYFIYLKK